MSATPIFFWNGIKDAKGAKLQRCSYSDSRLTRYPEGTISLYARDYSGFSALVRSLFTVKNETDIMVDYFETDAIRVAPDHPLYPEVRKACDAHQAHNAKLFGRYLVREGMSVEA